MPDSNWNESRQYIVSEIERLKAEIRDLRQQNSAQALAIAILQTRSSLWGGISGTIAAVLTTIGVMIAKGGRL